jgi:hypothetical protein
VSGKTAAAKVSFEAWLTVHRHDPTAVAWIVGPNGTLRWDVVTQQWVPVFPPEAKQTHE